MEDKESALEHVMGVLEDAHKCGAGIIPFLNYIEIIKLYQTCKIIQSDVLNSKILNLPIYENDRIHEHHMKWYRNRTKCSYNKWREHWKYLHLKKITFYDINDLPYILLNIKDDRNAYFWNYGPIDEDGGHKKDIILWNYDDDISDDEQDEKLSKIYDYYIYFMDAMSKNYNSSCIQCGCSSRKDSYGDRTCFCDTCNNHLTNECVYKTRSHNPCIKCGCLEEYNLSGERICFCKKCFSHGCVHTKFI